MNIITFTEASYATGLYMLFNNFLRPDPTCSCQVEPENAEHYFLRCHKHTIQRLVLFNSLRNFLPLRLEILLYG